MMDGVDVNQLWHINVEIPTDVDPNLIQIFHKLLSKIDPAWPWNSSVSIIVQETILRNCICRSCNGRGYYKPKLGGQGLRIVKEIAKQVGFEVKIRTFVKHKTCDSSFPGKVFRFIQ